MGAARDTTDGPDRGRFGRNGPPRLGAGPACPPQRHRVSLSGATMPSARRHSPDQLRQGPDRSELQGPTPTQGRDDERLSGLSRAGPDAGRRGREEAAGREDRAHACGHRRLRLLRRRNAGDDDDPARSGTGLLPGDRAVGRCDVHSLDRVPDPKRRRAGGDPVLPRHATAGPDQLAAGRRRHPAGPATGTGAAGPRRDPGAARVHRGLASGVLPQRPRDQTRGDQGPGPGRKRRQHPGRGGGEVLHARPRRDPPGARRGRGR